MSANPTEIVERTLRECLPEGVPPSYQRIISARYEGIGRKRQIVAKLIMFDGLTAEVVLTPWDFGWSHRYHMASAVYWEKGRWNREPVAHPDLFALAGAA